MPSSPSLLGDAELHGLVDGHIEFGRRADVLRRLAASPADRALVDSWQQHNDLIRAAFRHVEEEPLPVALDLAPPRLRCVGQAPPPNLPPIRRDRIDRRFGGIGAALTLAVIAAGLFASWLMISQAGRDDHPASPGSQMALEERLADLAAGSAGVANSLGQNHESAGLPAARVPDLSKEGFTLSDASAEDTGVLTLRYLDSRGERVALGLARTAKSGTSLPAQIGESLVWRQHDVVFALAGSVPPDRLRDLATAIRTALDHK